MRWLSDKVLGRLRAEGELPDLSGTRYLPLRFLGSGGMGSVWLASDPALDRLVAIKIVPLENSPREFASRLMREALVLAQLEHPGIVPVHDAGTLADGRAFYCMKYVQGQTLDQFLPHVGLRERLQLVQRIAEPLAFAHSRGIVHRDLKPGNIMIGAFAEVLVMDWGLARILDRHIVQAPATGHNSNAETPNDSTTVHGSVFGTPGFMAPEQERGETALIDQRTDVFGLGAVLNFMLEGISPAPPRQLLAICRKAMAADMNLRYPSVQDLSADLARYLDGLPASVYRENLLERTSRLFLRHQAAIVLILAYLLMRLLFIIFSR